MLVHGEKWLDYDGITIEPRNLSGGLTLFWKCSIKIDTKYSDKNILDFHNVTYT